MMATVACIFALPRSSKRCLNALASGSVLAGTRGRIEQGRAQVLVAVAGDVRRLVHTGSRLEHLRIQAGVAYASAGTQGGRQHHRSLVGDGGGVGNTDDEKRGALKRACRS